MLGHVGEEVLDVCAAHEDNLEVPTHFCTTAKFQLFCTTLQQS